MDVRYPRLRERSHAKAGRAGGSAAQAALPGEEKARLVAAGVEIPCVRESAGPGEGEGEGLPARGRAVTLEPCGAAPGAAQSPRPVLRPRIAAGPQLGQ